MTHSPGTIGAALRAAVMRWSDRPFLVVPAAEGRDYLDDGWQATFAEVLAEVERLETLYAAAGYGHGHRVAIAVENRPGHVLHKLALNGLGASIAPVNPDYRPAEFGYLIDHCRPDLIVTIPAQAEKARAGLKETEHRPAIVLLDAVADGVPDAPRPAPLEGPPGPATEASLLYTSGTTGRPKGCILSHDYELAMADWYASLGGTARLEPGAERIFNPLPLYHINAGVLSLLGAMTIGCCQIVPDRFHPSTWWRDVARTEATVIHSLGVIVSMLMKREAGPEDRGHRVRLGIGAGTEPTLHAAFEERFGFPMVEVWGMTEACRVLADCAEPRQVGSRAIGRAVPGLEVKVVDGDGVELARGTPGEIVIRHSHAAPRKHAFSGYLDDDAATEQGWQGGWFHTGDTVVMDPDGMVHFVDRAKNIIRRSGENISAAEVEAVLLDHPAVAQIAVAPVDDDIRQEEVLACIVPAPGHEPGGALAREIVAWALERMAYYKPPGWVLFLDTLPTTGTQKIQKHRLFAEGEDPCARADIHDLRPLKKRNG